MAGSDAVRKYDAALMAALLLGATQEQAARRAGISLRTVQRRTADPEFRALMEEARRDTIRRTSVRLSTLADRASVTLGELLTDDDGSLRYRAAAKLLDVEQRRRMEDELVERIAALEAAVQAQARRR